MGTSIEDLTARAKQLIAERRYQEAVRACRRILLSRPAMGEVRILLGMALLALRRHDEVRAEMMAVLRATPEASVAHRLLGEAYLRDGQVDKARDSFTRALELDPSDDETRELLSEVADEEPVVSATIDRWFDPEAVATMQQDAPPFVEDQTGSLPRLDVEALTAVRDGDEIQGEPTVARPPSVPPPGFGGPMRRPPSAPPPPPPRRPSSFPPPQRPSSFPPPPASRPPSAGMAGAPRRAAPMPGPPHVPSFPVEVKTAAHTPQAKGADGPIAFDTQELNVSEVDELRPPISRSPYFEALEAPQPDDFDDDIATQAHVRGQRDYDPRDHQETEARPAAPELPGERTFAQARSAPPSPSFSPGGPAEVGSPFPPLHPPPGAPPVHAPHGAPLETPHLPPGSGPAIPAGPASGVATAERVEKPKKREKPKKTGGRSRIPLFIAGAVIPLVLGLAVFIGLSHYFEVTAEEEIATFVTRAEDDGLEATLARAIALAEDHDDDDPEDLALRARLYATLVLDHGEADRAAPAEALLALLDPEEGRHADAIVAAAYLALARGDVERAKAAVETVPIDDVAAAELLRARAISFERSGEYARALVFSDDARAHRPAAPRFVALNALLTARSQNVSAALETLDAIPDGAASPSVRIARARIIEISGSDPDRAAAEATAVLEQIEGATLPQRGWAHLIRARHALSQGDGSRAQAEAQSARDLRPPGNEEFGLELAELFVDAGNLDDADATMALLPEASVDPNTRARIEAAIALGRRDLAGATAALTRAGAGPDAEFLRGRVAEEEGRTIEARRHYQAAMEADQALRVPAAARLGGIAARAGDFEEAVERLSPMAEQDPANVEVVPLLVHALLELDRRPRAGEILDAAFRVQRPEGIAVATELLFARAEFERDGGDTEAAISTLTAVVEDRPDFAEAHRLLGTTAIAAGDMEIARRAFSRVLELVTDDPVALSGLAYVTVADGGDIEAMRAAIARAEEGDGDEALIDGAKARLMVLEGKGAEAAETLARMVRNSPDAGLWVALGQARVQAVSDRGAARAFDRALELDAQNPDALIGLALVRTRAGSTDVAARLLDRADAAIEARGLGAPYQARSKAGVARIRFELGRFDSAREAATEAIALDAACSDAHLVLASVTAELGGNPTAELRLAVEGRPPSVEAMGLLVLEIAGGRPSTEVCALGRRYLAAAPDGLDARDVRREIRRCR